MTLTKAETRLQIGVLGCGPIAQAVHFDACRKACNADLYAICDIAEDLLDQMRVIHQPQASYRNYDEMLADPQLDAVLIAVADQYHVPLCQKALSAGKHVLVEKPLGVTIEECERVRARVQRTGLVLQIGNNRRFDPGVAFAKQFMTAEMGERMAFKIWFYDSVHRYTMVDNIYPLIVQSKAAKRPSGNPKADRRRYLLMTQGSHLLDLAQFLQGDIISVHGARRVEKYGAYCWFLGLDFADGSVGHVELLITLRGDYEEGFHIAGEYGSIQGRLYLPFHHRSGEVECFSRKDGRYHRPLGEDAHTYKLQVEGFADTILHGRAMWGAGVEDGLATLRGLVAIARAVETGERVYLADVQGGV